MVSAYEVKGETSSTAKNLGTGIGYSVLDIVKNFEEANNIKLPYVIKARRPGDIATCYADATKANKISSSLFKFSTIVSNETF